MDINKLKLGDIVDAHIEGQPTQRVMVTRIYLGTEVIDGIDCNGYEYEVNPENEIESVIANINEL